MDVYQEKKKLLLEMIAFATVDGHLSKKGYDFVFLIANELKFERGGFIELLGEQLPSLPANLKLARIKQFYQLILLFQNDGIFYKQDPELIIHIAISMGLNIDAVNVLIKKINNSPNSIISDTILWNIFNE